MNRYACLIFNPVSGQGNLDRDLQRIRQQLEPTFQLDVYLTTPDGSDAELAQIAIAHPSELVIASGGDGTVSAVAQALIGTPKILGIIPCGTANAFATALGIPSDISLACDAILNGTPRSIDTAQCNDRTIQLQLQSHSRTFGGYEYETGRSDWQL